MLWGGYLAEGSSVSVSNSCALHPEDGRRTSLQNVGNFPLDYTASHAIKQQSSKWKKKKKLQGVQVIVDSSRIIRELVLEVHIDTLCYTVRLFISPNCAPAVNMVAYRAVMPPFLRCSALLLTQALDRL